MIVLRRLLFILLYSILVVHFESLIIFYHTMYISSLHDTIILIITYLPTP